jgi:hypothetical protein
MNRAIEEHQRAMGLAEQAHLARIRGDHTRAIEMSRLALASERVAASLVGEVEPTRSILYRSAASLALDCGEQREAERLIAEALAGNPPNEIADELRDLLEQVYFQRHLTLRGIQLQPGEFQLTLNGGAVGFGIAQSEEFVERVKDLENLVYRTAERKIGRPFRERGRRRDALQRDVELYISVPRAASFAVTFRLGSNMQLELSGVNFAEGIIEEVLDCFDLFDRAATDVLKQRIPDPAYYRNFFGLARKIAPDGEGIRSVGLTALHHNQERRVILTRPRRQVPSEEIIVAPTPDAIESTVVTVRGTLRFSDSRDERAGIIELIARDGRQHRIQVPPGMMRDIVRPYYEDEVVVTGRMEGNLMQLNTIDAAESEAGSPS